MSSSNLVRWSGLAALIGGVLFVVLNIAESLLFANQSDAEAAATIAWIIVQVAYIGAIALIALGLVGLYVRQAEYAGRLGLVAFLVVFSGAIMGAGSSWSEAFLGAWLADAAPELLEADPSGAVVAGLLLTFGLFALGGLLFGLVSLRAGVLPRGAAVLLMIGAVLYPVLGSLEAPFAGVVFGAAVAWLGYALWSSAAGESTRLAEAAA
jgi:hypothetical protein